MIILHPKIHLDFNGFCTFVEQSAKKAKMSNKIVNSNIISASVPGEKKDNMVQLPKGEYVYYTLEHKTVCLNFLVEFFPATFFFFFFFFFFSF